jgi:hypothetical protein
MNQPIPITPHTHALPHSYRYHPLTLILTLTLFLNLIPTLNPNPKSTSSSLTTDINDPLPEHKQIYNKEQFRKAFETSPCICAEEANLKIVRLCATGSTVWLSPYTPYISIMPYTLCSFYPVLYALYHFFPIPYAACTTLYPIPYTLYRRHSP